MNSELDLDDLELKSAPDEVVEEDKPADGFKTAESIKTPEIVDVQEDIEQAATEVVKIVENNVLDTDLKIDLVAAVQKHFDELKKNPRGFNRDFYAIPDLNQAIWNVFHEYEGYINQNRIQNADLEGLNSVIRNHVTPNITDYLTDRVIAKSQER